MSKKSIDHCYNIEYIYPDMAKVDSKKTQPKKGKFLLFFLLILVLLIAGFLFQTGNLSNYLQALVSSNSKIETVAQAEKITNKQKQAEKVNTPLEAVKTQEDFATQKTAQVTQKTIGHQSTTAEVEQVEESTDSILEELTQMTSTQPAESQSAPQAASTNLQDNDDLIASLDQLTEQLIVEKKKSKSLENQLKKNENLSLLLDKTLSKTTPDDKQYISALKDLAKDKVYTNKKDENEEKQIVVDNKVVVLTNKVANSTLTAAKKSSSKSDVDYSNTVDVSMESQVNAILLAMKDIKPAYQRQKKSNTPSRIVEETVVSRTDSEKKLTSQNNNLIDQLEELNTTETEPQDELISVELESKINQLITTKQLSGTNYQNALKKEAKERKNAIRSVIVKKGETLWSISKRAYGDGKLYKKILKANPQITRDGVLKLSIGQKIRVPI